MCFSGNCVVGKDEMRNDVLRSGFAEGTETAGESLAIERKRRGGLRRRGNGCCVFCGFTP